jgi:hypothetical protein
MLSAPVRMLRSGRCLPLSPKLRKKETGSPRRCHYHQGNRSILDERGQTIKKGLKELRTLYPKRLNVARSRPSQNIHLPIR